MGADIGALAVECCGVVCGKEHVEDVGEWNYFRRKDYLDDFCVPGGAGANFFIGWIRRGAPHISGGHLFDAFKALEDGFDAPEASAAERYGVESGFLWHTFFVCLWRCF